MTWNAEVTRYVDNDAEIVVHVDYWADGQPAGISSQKVHHEEATFPSGTPKRKILDEFSRRGRSARLAMGKAKPQDPMVGEFFDIDQN